MRAALYSPAHICAQSELFMHLNATSAACGLSYSPAHICAH